MEKKKLFNQQIENRWANVYWFLRMIISNDKYVAIGKKSNLISKICSSLRIVAQDNKNSSESEVLQLQFQVLRNILLENYKKAKSVHPRLERLLNDLEKEIKTLPDMEV